MDAKRQEKEVVAWIERGKQIGKSLSIDRGGRRFYIQVAIQKQEDSYKVIVDEIDEALMAAEIFEREDVRTFDDLNDALIFIESTTPVKVADLKPSKGQKWF